VPRFNSKNRKQGKKMKSLYIIDVGIGFIKRAYRQDGDSDITTKSEVSTLSPVPRKKWGASRH